MGEDGDGHGASYAKTRGDDMRHAAGKALTIRRAGLDDAEALARIGAATFTETFGHLYPPADLAAFLDESHSVARARADLADPAKAAWLVEAEGETVGYALVGPCKLPHPEVTPACGELDRIYILASHRGAGAGSRLLEETLTWLERDGPRRLWIGVWSENLGAQRLYARRGFEVVGTYEFKVGESRDHEFIMRRG
jgi:ribosomal protein S18 acetylase RimI-like enzyme